MKTPNYKGVEAKIWTNNDERFEQERGSGGFPNDVKKVPKLKMEAL
jgi:hypothetical protein